MSRKSTALRSVLLNRSKKEWRPQWLSDAPCTAMAALSVLPTVFVQERAFAIEGYLEKGDAITHKAIHKSNDSEWVHYGERVFLEAKAYDVDRICDAGTNWEWRDSGNNIDFRTTSWRGVGVLDGPTMGRRVLWAPAQPTGSAGVRVRATLKDYEDDQDYHGSWDEDNVTVDVQMKAYEVIVSVSVPNHGSVTLTESLQGTEGHDSIVGIDQLVETHALADAFEPRRGGVGTPRLDESDEIAFSTSATWTFNTNPAEAVVDAGGSLVATLGLAGFLQLDAFVADSDLDLNQNANSALQVSVGPSTPLGGVTFNYTLPIDANRSAVTALAAGIYHLDSDIFRSQTDDLSISSDNDPELDEGFAGPGIAFTTQKSLNADVDTHHGGLNFKPDDGLELIRVHAQKAEQRRANIRLSSEVHAIIVPRGGIFDRRRDANGFNFDFKGIALAELAGLLDFSVRSVGYQRSQVPPTPDEGYGNFTNWW